ncbi:MAG TPA: hypothetical protein VIQ24_22710, partial [Pyrinomonadaceae bacterium]
MPKIYCLECAKEIYIDAFSTPYLGEFACPGCLTKLQVSVTMNNGSTVARKNPSLDDLKPVWDDLAEIEQHSLREASLCIGAGAYTASEAMSLRTLEALLRRVYQVNEMFGQLLARMEQDIRLKEFHGVFHYFKDTRNRVSH